MDGILVVNHFLNTSKYNELHLSLISTAKRHNIDLKIKTNLELSTGNVNTDFVLFWDKDVNLARRLETEGNRVFNSSDSIFKCDDKARTYIELFDKVPQSKTIISPKTYFEVDMSEFIYNAVEVLNFPIVFKECFGSYGFQVYLCNSVDEIKSHITDKPFILQKYIKESCGSDTRLEIVNGECVAAVRRENKNDFRSNVTNGGKMISIKPNDIDIKNAVKACEILGLTFGGVDVLDNGDICEVNSNAHIINIMNATNIDVAKYIFEAIREKIQ